eukprot:COSAG02_NODE_1369_length_13028_cov_2.767345_2_plen_178_part_00
MEGTGSAASAPQGSGVLQHGGSGGVVAATNGALNGSSAASGPTQFVPPPQHAPRGFGDGGAQPPVHDGSFDQQETLTREQRFEAALSCREEGKGVKPRQGCASVQLNRECKEGTRTAGFVKFLEVVRQTADSEVLSSHGANPGIFDRADYMKVERPLHCAHLVPLHCCRMRPLHSLC